MEKINRFVRSSTNTVYYTHVFTDEFSVTDYGLFKLINKDKNREISKAVLLPEVKSYFETLLARGEPFDHWEKMHYRLLMSEYCSLSLMVYKYSDGVPDRVEIQEWVNDICNTFNGNMNYAEALLRDEQPDLNRISQLLDKAESLKDQMVLKSEAGKLMYLKGELYVKTGDLDKAIDNYKKSYASWPHPDNPALSLIQEYSKMRHDNPYRQ
jgi:tetratricopeptide (TPR) repeat protein